MRRSVRIGLNCLTGAAVAALAVALLSGPIRNLRRMHTTGVGLSVATQHDSLTDAVGARRSLLARDSVTLVMFFDPNCEACQKAVPLYGRLIEWAKVQGIASRVLLAGNKQSAADFGTLAGDRSVVFGGPLPWAAKLDIREFPVILLLDRSGRITGRWTGELPAHLAVLNALARVDRRHALAKGSTSVAP